MKQHNITAKINIYSPELDAQLIKSLIHFTYPQEFKDLITIINSLVLNGSYDDDFLHLELFIGDAREYILKFEDNMFDIIYQDAFSPTTNPILWTQEYFRDIARIIKQTGILTTYSIALSTRLALYENSFHIYVHSGEDFRDSTLASLCPVKDFKEVNIEHKISCNPKVESLRDE